MEWTIDLEQNERQSRSGRKTRPPKSLGSDYYIGQSRSRNAKEVYTTPVKKKDLNIKCNFTGYNCYSKFSTQENLEIHMKCHVPGDSMFKCCECRAVFTQWGKLRLHLWQKHKTDIDLLTCDICKVYKCDSHCKMLIHKEVSTVYRENFTPALF